MRLLSSNRGRNTPDMIAMAALEPHAAVNGDAPPTCYMREDSSEKDSPRLANPLGLTGLSL